ncbi:Panacea domain-containing protein [Thioalkalivibrio sp. HK1]|uniref:Panacea domain-containing protein n=1 Tax=Thioalkalivibrio sp. HK1 TaxID=1469245 RepID=UPI0004B63767|nr:Panacea domain-containing protein [Thioalkalivibrio sp. HK1]
MPPPIKFRFAPKKCLQAVQWMLLTANEPLEFQTILKTAYFADKRMLDEHWRSIFGATYRAMNHGPVPVEIYEMLIEEPYYLSELDLSGYPWKRENGHWVRLIDSDSDRRNTLICPSSIPEKDMAILEEEFARSRKMRFDQRTRETHRMDWSNGMKRPDNRMAYEDMIADDNPDREEILEYLTSMGPRIVL